MSTVNFHNAVGSEIVFEVIGPDGNSTGLVPVAVDSTQPVGGFPVFEFAVAAWRPSDNKLVHLGKLVPSAATYEITQNQASAAYGSEISGTGHSFSYQPRR